MKFSYYSNYTLEDFLSDPDFVKLINGIESRERQIYFDQWIRSNPPNLDDAFLAREIILSLSSQSLEPGKEDYDEVLSGIINKQVKQRSIRQVLIDSNYPFIKWAAMVLLIAATSLILYNLLDQSQAIQKPLAEANMVRENPTGQRSQFRLPDGTRVWLNAESRLDYSEPLNGNQRHVNLVGEAYFEVAKDPSKPFTVKSGDYLTTAIGTAFNVNSFYSDEVVDVALIEGEVQVTNLTAALKVTLLPGERAIGTKGGKDLKKAHFNALEKTSWREGSIYFKDASLDEVVTVLSRWYDVKIEIIGKPKIEWNYTGIFEKISLESVLQRMSFTEDFTYEINGKIITLKF